MMIQQQTLCTTVVMINILEEITDLRSLFPKNVYNNSRSKITSNISKSNKAKIFQRWINTIKSCKEAEALQLAVFHNKEPIEVYTIDKKEIIIDTKDGVKRFYSEEAFKYIKDLKKLPKNLKVKLRIEFCSEWTSEIFIESEERWKVCNALEKKKTIDDIRCRCKINTNDGDMIQCDKCDNWLHTVCCGFYSNSDKRIPESYHCCEEFSNSVNIYDKEGFNINNTVENNTVQNNTLQNNTIKNNSIKNNIIQNNTIQSNLFLFRRILSIIYNERGNTNIMSLRFLSTRLGIKNSDNINILERLEKERFIKRKNFSYFSIVKDEIVKEKIRSYFNGKKDL